MGEARAVNPLVDQFRRGGVPPQLRLLAAQGALPLKPEDLLELLHFLLHDREEEVRSAAGQTLGAMPAAELLPILKDRETPAQVLAWALAGRPEPELREAVLQNASTPDEAIEAECPRLPQELAELVVINQVRLLRRTSLLEALETNAALSNDQRRRLRELRETFRIGPQPAERPAPAEAPPVEPPSAEADEETFQDLPTAASDEDAVTRYLTDEERKDAANVSTVQKLYRLTMAEKVVTALKGTRAERSVLVRDPNRIVATAVLGSPRLTEAEVESFATMRNISDEVLRLIGNNRDWVKRYNVIANLVKNPRTPLAVSLGMVARLNPRDIKSLALDKNVPEPVRRQAQKFVKGAAEGPKRG